MEKLLSQNKRVKRKFYLTKLTFEKIKKDYDNLKSIRLAKTRGETPKFFHSDELDPEYFDFQDDLTLLESKLSDLEFIIENVEVIKTPPKKEQKVIHVGAIVEVDIDGQIDEFKILGSVEANPVLGTISNESPVGKALLGRKVGDEIIISSPIKTHYRIKKIKYEG